MGTISKLLLNMLEHESKQTRFVLSAAKHVDLKFTPKEGLRSLIDLANHIAQIPLIDLKFYSMEFKTFEEVQAVEKRIRKRSIDELLMVYDQGIETIKEFISKLSDEQLLENNLKVILSIFYQDSPEKSWSHYVPEITTHLAMHKMQLWMYLKLSGAPVSMWTYYGIPQSE
ncbi:hypothetical protein E4H12_13945 [Candidatus Thorarchaeota archaeon]|nr:MAG: hypothetical protein E4H12_13945 [Candidatus Thorarchaeota archaeon]